MHSVWHLLDLTRTLPIATMGKRLFVGNMPYNTTSADLEAHFAAAGNVEKADVLVDKFSGRSKGFGFVEMATDEDAQNAISMLNGKELGGRALVVNEARPREERAPRRGNDFGGDRGF